MSESGGRQLASSVIEAVRIVATTLSLTSWKVFALRSDDEMPGWQICPSAGMPATKGVAAPNSQNNTYFRVCSTPSQVCSTRRFIVGCRFIIVDILACGDISKASLFSGNSAGFALWEAAAVTSEQDSFYWYAWSAELLGCPMDHPENRSGSWPRLSSSRDRRAIPHSSAGRPR